MCVCVKFLLRAHPRRLAHSHPPNPLHKQHYVPRHAQNHFSVKKIAHRAQGRSRVPSESETSRDCMMEVELSRQTSPTSSMSICTAPQQELLPAAAVRSPPRLGRARGRRPEIGFFPADVSITVFYQKRFQKNSFFRRRQEPGHFEGSRTGSAVALLANAWRGRSCEPAHAKSSRSTS